MGMMTVVIELHVINLMSGNFHQLTLQRSFSQEDRHVARQTRPLGRQSLEQILFHGE